jgi:LmbE family N-acetylglucosaminyl deacetylase
MGNSFRFHSSALTPLAACCVLFVAIGIACPSVARAADSPSPQAILQNLRSFGGTGTVLLIAAHPDDENNQLIAYLARSRNCRIAYLSLTRGDGGQNVLGPEFGEELGLLRTEELLAARRVDGGRQFFSRAIDFGFSKDYRQTLTVWDRQQVVSDIVRIIREFRPDVMVTRFSTVPGGTHGHHTASAVLGLEAFKLAGDPKSFPEQLDKLTVWQPKRIFYNGGGPGVAGIGRGATPGGAAGGATAIRIDDGGNDPVTGEAISAIAGRSRSMHKTQGFGNAGGGGRGGAGAARSESFQLLAGEPASKDILDGVDTTWARYPGGADLVPLADQAVTGFDPKNPSASVPLLLTIKSKLATLAADPVIDEKRRRLDGIIQACLGLTVTTTVTPAQVVPGETMQLHHTVALTSTVPVRWVSVQYPSVHGQLTGAVELKPNQPATRDQSQLLPADTPLTQPYWLREDGTAGMSRVDDPALIGRPESPPAFPVQEIFEVAGQTLTIDDQAIAAAPAATPAIAPAIVQPMDVIAPVSLKFAADVELFAPGAARPCGVEITAWRPGSSGSIRLEPPAGWQVSPASQSFSLAAVGEKATYTFTVTAPSGADAASGSAPVQITARATVGGVTYDNQRIVIGYPHIPTQMLQPAARLKALCLNLSTRGKNIGYVAGAGDSVADCLTQMGYSVKNLNGPDLTANGLAGLDAVVIGVRAYNVRTDLAAGLPALFAFVESGGNVIAQYNRPAGLQTPSIAPYSLRLSENRVTDFRSTMTFLAPDHPGLNTPNKITPADFDGWVQERGIYFPDQWDTHFTPILACNDAGESPLKSGILIAQYGKGYFVYTGFSWFRELPAGVPGAYRLFANLVSLGK